MPNILSDVSQIKNQNGSTTEYVVKVNNVRSIAVGNIYAEFNNTVTTPGLTVGPQLNNGSQVTGEGGEVSIGAATGYVTARMDNYFGDARFHVLAYDGYVRITGTDGTCDIDRNGLVNPSWTTATLTNSWFNWGAPHNSAGYYKDKTGLVRLRGVVRSGTMDAAIFTLPVGFRPPYIQMMTVRTDNGYGRVDIDTAGVVRLVVGSNVHMSLDGIEFRIT